MKRGRKSLAQKLCEGDWPDDQDPHFQHLVIYDFEGRRIHHRFFKNLRRVFQIEKDGARIQYSAMLCEKLRTANIVVALCAHYGCKKARIFKVVK